MKISRSPKINLNDYYENGASQTLVIKEYYLRMLDSIEKMEWIPATFDGNYNKVPSWATEATKGMNIDKSTQESMLGKDSLKNCPGDLIGVLEEMLNDERVIGDISSVYKLRLDFVDLWDGVEELNWHWDGPSESEMISLIYFNEQNLSLDYGGSLEIGVRKIQPGKNWAKEYDSVNSVGIFPPSGRTQIWINNRNPKFVHKTKKLEDNNKPRVTLTFGVTFLPLI